MKGSRPGKKLLKGLGTRFVYLIGDEGAILIYIEGGAVQRRLFAPTPEPQHTNSFIELMREYPAAPVYVLIDMMDQSYIRHTLPPVTALGLNKIIQRRLERDFSKDDIKGALNLGRETAGRKDWNVLLISLAATKELQAWLDLVYDLDNRLMGIYLVPVESEYIIADLAAAVEAREDGEESAKKRKKKAPKPPKGRKKSAGEKAQRQPEWKILVSHNKVGGYRQVVVKDGQLVFTRMTQAIEGSNELQAGSVEQETLNTIEYLKRLSYNENAPLDIYLITAQEVKNNIARERFGRARLHILTPYDAAELLQLKQAVLSADRFGDVVIASAFGMAKKHRLRLMPNLIQKLEMLYKAKLGIRVAGAAMIVGLVGYLGYSAIAIPTSLSETQTLQKQKDGKQAELTKFDAQTKDLKVNPDEVNDLVSFMELARKPYPNPLDAVRTMVGVVSTEFRVVHDFTWITTQPGGPAIPIFAGAAPAVAPAPAAGTNAPAGPVRMEIAFDVAYARTQWDIFVRQTDEFIAAFGKAFPDYHMEHTSLPGQAVEGGNLTVNFEELEQRENSKEQTVFPINFTLTGPAAAPATAAPGASGAVP